MNPVDKGRNAFEAALEKRLGQSALIRRPDCPESEVIAAYYERALAADERERVEAHFSDCARCQVQLAAITRSDPHLSVASRPPRGYVWLPGWRVAISAFAAILVVAVAIGQMRKNSRHLSPAQLAVASPSATGAPASPNRSVTSQAATSTRAETALNETSRAIEPSGAKGPQGPQGAAGPTALEMSSAEGKGAPSTVMVPAQHGVAFWRLGARGMIEYSSDGKTFVRIKQSSVSTDLLAGSAPSESVCWAVGRQGTVTRTRDAVDWEKRLAPTSSDLIRVMAQDASIATVYTADGTSYSTSDGGRHWSSMSTTTSTSTFATGATGPLGPQGATGATGPTGSVGPPGP